MIFYSITSNAEFSGATVIFTIAAPQVVSSDHEKYAEILELLLAKTEDEEYLLSLIAPGEAAFKSLEALTERISRKGSQLYLDHDPLPKAFNKHIIQIMDEGNDELAWKGWLAFAEKLATNPSKKSRKHLFNFIISNGLQTTPDGDMVLYKGVTAEGRSLHQGYGIVDGVVVEHDFLLNEVGSVVEMPRSMVDDDTYEGCSVGLHAGAFGYASRFGARLMTVTVNPRDVVSVPANHGDEKMRVCRYVVKELNAERTHYSGSYHDFGDEYDQADSDYFEDAFIDDPEPDEEEAPEPDEDDADVDAAEADEDYPLSTPGGSPAGTYATPGLVIGSGSVAVGPNSYTTYNSTAMGYNAYTDEPDSRVSEYVSLIKSGGAGDNLRKYRNKRVTPGRRDEFDQAVQRLGLQY